MELRERQKRHKGWSWLRVFLQDHSGLQGWRAGSRRGEDASIPPQHNCWKLSSTSSLQRDWKHCQGYSHSALGFIPLLGKCFALHTHPLTDREQRSVHQEPQWQNRHLKNRDLKSVGVPLSASMASALPSVRASLLQCVHTHAVWVCVCVSRVFCIVIIVWCGVPTHFNEMKAIAA